MFIIHNSKLVISLPCMPEHIVNQWTYIFYGCNYIPDQWIHLKTWLHPKFNLVHHTLSNQGSLYIMPIKLNITTMRIIFMHNVSMHIFIVVVCDCCCCCCLLCNRQKKVEHHGNTKTRRRRIRWVSVLQHSKQKRNLLHFDVIYLDCIRYQAKFADLCNKLSFPTIHSPETIIFKSHNHFSYFSHCFET